jgi:hypothetical protein
VEGKNQAKHHNGSRSSIPYDPVRHLLYYWGRKSYLCQVGDIVGHCCGDYLHWGWVFGVFGTADGFMGVSQI